MMRLVALALAVSSAVACGSNFKPETFANPQSLYEASVAASERGDCGDAKRGFERLLFELAARDQRVPDSRFLLAECHFSDGEYLEASREFRRVAEEHADHERAPLALLRAGDALARLWRRPELDPTYGQNALSTYGELLRRYPQSEAAIQGRDRAAVLADQFALKDLKTGNFYLRLRAYDSAILYFKNVVALYPESPHAAKALVRLVDVYRRIGYEEEATETCTHLRRFFPAADGVDQRCPVPAAP
ncbi:MAG TPA: outer membrane protein assembly factor BamD [Gemmatimonadales bacterium]